MKQLPSSIKINSIIIPIEIVDVIDGDNDFAGKFWGNLPLIKIKKASYELMLQTFFHETLHALEYFHNLHNMLKKDDGFSNESYIDGLAFALCAFFESNPYVLDLFKTEQPQSSDLFGPLYYSMEPEIIVTKNKD